MKGKNILRERKQRVGIAIGFILLLGIYFCISPFFLSPENIRKVVCQVERESYYVLMADKKEVLFVKQIVDGQRWEGCYSTKEELETEKTYAIGSWINRYPLLPSCKGRLISHFALLDIHSINSQAKVRKMIDQNKAETAKRKNMLKHRLSETAYYLKVHRVADEGYNSIAKYDVRLKKEWDELLKVEKKLNEITEKTLVEWVAREQYFLVKGEERLPLKIIKSDVNNQLVMLQTEDQRTPKDAHALSVLPWKNDENGEIFAATFKGLTKTSRWMAEDSCTIVAGQADLHRKHDFPTLLVSNSSPLFNGRGNFMGISKGEKYINRKTIYSFIQQ